MPFLTPELLVGGRKEKKVLVMFILSSVELKIISPRCLSAVH